MLTRACAAHRSPRTLSRTCRLSTSPTSSLSRLIYINTEKFPLFPTLPTYPTSTTKTLLNRIKLDLTGSLQNHTLAFNSTSFYETPVRRVIQCTTRVYSFGTMVVETKELQQALFVPPQGEAQGRFLYGFEFVNSFMDAFFKGLGMLERDEEVDAALGGLGSRSGLFMHTDSAQSRFRFFTCQSDTCVCFGCYRYLKILRRPFRLISLSSPALQVRPRRPTLARHFW